MKNKSDDPGCLVDAMVSRLRVERTALIRKYNGLPRRESFSGLAIAEQIENVERELGEAEWSAANDEMRDR